MAEKVKVKPSRALVKRETRSSYLFLLPSLIFFAGFVLYPMFMCAYTSFFNATMNKEDVFIGLQNYKELLGDPVFRKALLNTVIIVLVSVPITCIFSLWVSSAIIRMPEKLTSLFRVFPGRKMDRLLVSISGQTVVTKIHPQIQKMIGGGVSAQNKLLIEPLKRRVREHVIPAFAEHLEIRAAALRNSAGLVGAVAWFMQEHSEV